MKYLVQILFLVCALQVNGQSACNSYGIVSSTEQTSMNDSLDSEGPRQITLFSQIDFDNAKTISILYESVKDDPFRACYLDDISIIASLSQQYTDSEVIKNPDYFSQSDIRNLLVIENKDSVHQYTYDNNSNLLYTECGAINFEIEKIAKACKTVKVKTHNEYHHNKKEAANRINELYELDDLIYRRQPEWI